MAIFLNGLGLRNYRSIGPDLQKMAPFKKFNFFIGANNSGKSTILNFIFEHLPPPQAQFGSPRPTKYINGLEVYLRGLKGNASMCLGITIEKFIENCLKVVTRNGGHANTLVREDIANIAQRLSENSMIWFSCSLPYTKDLIFEKSLEFDAGDPMLTQRLWNHVWMQLTKQSGGSLSSHWVTQTLGAMLAAQSFSLPSIKMIPAIRQIGPKGEDFADFSGRGLIDRLAEIQSPDHDKLADKDQFEKINRFLQTVTSEKSARIEIPHNRTHVLVHMNDKLLPISSLGMGIHEVVMIATFCTVSENQIICIEEPEIHLHPILQRKLIDYLLKETSNQYFVTTHSSNFIDTEGAAIFHVTNDGVQARISESILRKERLLICSDLGHRASKIIQSNAVIWVEGPSDRIYIRQWLKQLSPLFLEGIHYSVMFYGGRLLSHLSAKDDEIDEFVNLRSLNQNLAVIMDSDKTNLTTIVNDTKQRIISEFSSGPGLAWLTSGREIENYVNPEILQQAIKRIYDKAYDRPASIGRFDHALHFYRKEKKRRGDGSLVGALLEKDVDKVKVARLVCEQPLELNVLDLEENLRKLVSLIENANR